LTGFLDQQPPNADERAMAAFNAIRNRGKVNAA
jgi:hypothetical protein